MGISIIFGRLAIQDNETGMLFLEGACWLLILLGFALGIIALFGIKKYGRKGIFGRAIAGICINGAFIILMLISLPAMIQAERHSKQMQQQRQSQQ